ISTVGDGLMSQIPALLISVATGMLVTRSTSDADLNTDVIQQFTKQPMVLMIAGAVMPFLILIGFPPIQGRLIAVTLVGGGLISSGMEKRQTEEVPEAPAVMEEVTSEVDYYKNLDNVYALLTVDPICIEVGYSLLPLVDQNSGGRFMDR